MFIVLTAIKYSFNIFNIILAGILIFILLKLLKGIKTKVLFVILFIKLLNFLKRMFIIRKNYIKYFYKINIKN